MSGELQTCLKSCRRKAASSTASADIKIQKIIDPIKSKTSNMGKPGSSHFRDPPLISEESPLKSEAVLIKYLDFWDR